MIVMLVIIIVCFFPYSKVISQLNSGILNELEGQIYYTKRVGGINTLFKAQANLENEELIYSHKGKGDLGSGEYNDNIIAFHYDLESQVISFCAMDDGTWSLFEVKEGTDEAIRRKQFDEKEVDQAYILKTDYVELRSDKKHIYTEKGSIYLIIEGKSKCIKKFIGIYDGKFTGYQAIGLSPNGEYLIYTSSEHLTPIGTILEGILTNSIGTTYIMDLETGKSTKYIEFSRIQWI